MECIDEQLQLLEIEVINDMLIDNVVQWEL